MNDEKYKKLFSYYSTKMEYMDALFNPIDKPPKDDACEKSITNWLEKNETHRALVRINENTDSFLVFLLKDYQRMNAEQRTLIRKLFKKHQTFSSSVFIEKDSRTSEEYFFDSFLLVSIKDYEDTRDIIMQINWLSKKAKEEEVMFHSMKKTIANLSSDINHHGMGSMKSLLE